MRHARLLTDKGKLDEVILVMNKTEFRHLERAVEDGNSTISALEFKRHKPRKYTKLLIALGEVEAFE